MKKLGMLTLGQSPRDDLTPLIVEILGDQVELIQAGALDDVTYEEVQKLPLVKEDYILVSRMRDGRQIKITKKQVLPLLQRRLDWLEEQGVRTTVVMCTGKFSRFRSKGIVVTPQEIMKGVLESVLKQGKLGIIYPTAEQEYMAEAEYGRPELEIYADSVSPYEPEDVDGLIERLNQQDVDLVFLNCFGFPRSLQQKIINETGKPTLLSNALIARVLKELIF